jgi:hypothetical protein
MRATVSLCISIIAVSVACRAQQQTPANDRVPSVVARMASPDMATRHAGFDDLINIISEGQKLGFDPEYPTVLATFLARHPEHAERVKLGLINLLQADDNAFTDGTAGPRTHTESDSEHWAAAIDLVSCLKDERAIPALVDAMTAGGGLCKGLLQYGQKPLGPLLSKLNNPDPFVRSTAIGTAITILRMKNDSDSQARIVGLIRAAIQDKEFLIRSAAVYQIDNLTDQKELARALQEFVPVLQEMAQRDPFIVQGQTNYPLRDRAKKLLDKITNN